MNQRSRSVSWECEEDESVEIAVRVKPGQPGRTRQGQAGNPSTGILYLAPPGVGINEPALEVSDDCLSSLTVRTLD
ncbi:hypothetical protein ElyMa_003709900 [Elysia marginata]|uniref:Uncharacterized protein n=1 Tax=Elysia marginata TaxID=1093978 RepID=A0AAV4F2J8_9GAST|nr:hypothetical protein ElyMa_003709900 [Elysia marginata]